MRPITVLKRGGNLLADTDAIDLLRAMLEIPSASGQEAKLARFVVRAMRERGFRAAVDEAGNAVGEIGRGDRPMVMLLSHLDTIGGSLAVRSEAGRLYGRGAVDAKGPLAAMICAAARLPDFAGRIVVVGAVEEETPQSRGAMAIRATLPQPDMLVIGEPSGWSTVVLGYKGKLDVRYHVACKPTHPSNPEPKASELAAACWAALLAELGPEAGHGSFSQPGSTLMSISGDLTTADLEFSVRTPPGFDSGLLMTALRARVQAGEFTVINSVTACRADRRNPVVRALNLGIRAAGGVPAATLKTATSDMNTLAEAWDVPMATYGPGDSRLDHSDDEHITLADYVRAITVLTTALGELADESEQPAPKQLTAAGRKGRAS